MQQAQQKCLNQLYIPIIASIIIHIIASQHTAVTADRHRYQLHPSKQCYPSAHDRGLCTTCMSSVPYLRVLHRLSIGKGGVQGKSAQ